MIRVTIETADGVVFSEDSADFEEVRNTFRDHAAAMGVTVVDFLQQLVAERYAPRSRPSRRRRPRANPSKCVCREDLAPFKYISDADLRGKNLQGIDASNATFTKVDFLAADLSHANLTGAIFHKTDLIEATLVKTIFDGAELDGVDFSNATMNDAVLEKAELKEAIFAGATLRGACFDGADLSGARLQEARIEGADFRGAYYDDDTTWPPGFDPDAAGAIYAG